MALLQWPLEAGAVDLAVHVGALLERLRGTLQLEFAYAELQPEAGGSALELVCSTADAPALRADGEACALARSTPYDPSLAHALSSASLIEPTSKRALRVCCLRVGGLTALGVLKLASVRADFPTKSEGALLQLAASQLALVLHEARSASQQAHAQAERRAQRAHDREAAALTMSELSATLLHDLNQPLAAVITNANAARRWLAFQPPDLAEASAATERIAHEARRASELVQRIHAHGRGGSAPSEAVPLGELFEHVLWAVRDELRAAGVTPRVAPLESFPAIQGDRTQLHHVLLQLVLNALEAMSSVPDGSRLLELAVARESDSELRLTVRDSGPGLQFADRDQAFRAFQTTKPQGRGLGLSVGRSLVRALGGRLWATPNAEGGESFHFTVPVAPT
ncbi:MAG: histidine kinase [Myxococcaceae bacterium]|nr:histidine kinase [Myxococcaceae bacterium]